MQIVDYDARYRLSAFPPPSITTKRIELARHIGILSPISREEVRDVMTQVER